MIQSKRVSKIVNILILITLITTMFFTGSVVAEVDIPTSEPEQITEPSENTNLQVATTDAKQIPAGQAEYTAKYYVEQFDGSFLLAKTITKVGIVGEIASIRYWDDSDIDWDELGGPNTKTYFVIQYRDYNLPYPYDFDEDYALSGVVKEDGSLVLKAYLTRASMHVSFFDHEYKYLKYAQRLRYGLNYDVIEAPYREGCQFEYWLELPPHSQRLWDLKELQEPLTGCETKLPLDYYWVGYGVRYVKFDGIFDVNSKEEIPTYGFGEYVPIYKSVPPTPTPVTTPTPEPITIPTPNPGRTCQDDGYADGYTWNGTACVLPEVYVVPNTAAK